MTNIKLALHGFLHAAGTIIYITLVSLLLFNGSMFFGNGNSVLNVITMLCLLVLSITVVGTLLLGRPILWYFNGAKTEAVKLFFYSLIWLLGFTVVFLIMMATVFRQPPYIL